jgi:hypothetical protein
MLNNPSPLPLNEDADTVVFTNSPVSGDIDAVTLPLAIRGVTSALTPVNPEPSPTKKSAVTLPVIN